MQTKWYDVYDVIGIVSHGRDAAMEKQDYGYVNKDERLMTEWLSTPYHSNKIRALPFAQWPHVR